VAERGAVRGVLRAGNSGFTVDVAMMLSKLEPSMMAEKQEAGRGRQRASGQPED
jgi:hypothetical protein